VRPTDPDLAGAPMAFATATAPFRGILSRALASCHSVRPVAAAAATAGRARMASTPTSEHAAARRAEELRGPEAIFAKIVSKVRGRRPDARWPASTCVF
jgi:hypothetical protein